MQGPVRRSQYFLLNRTEPDFRITRCLESNLLDQTCSLNLATWSFLEAILRTWNRIEIIVECLPALNLLDDLRSFLQFSKLHHMLQSATISSTVGQQCIRQPTLLYKLLVWGCYLRSHGSLWFLTAHDVPITFNIYCSSTTSPNSTRQSYA